MKVYSSYKVKIKNYNKIFENTIKIYREAVSFFLNVCNNEWDILKNLTSSEYVNKADEYNNSIKSKDWRCF